jgi:hypothetical protein
LEIAGVMGSEFAAAAVSAGREEYVDQLEKYRERLAQQQILWLAPPASWSDGAVAARYEFTHTLYQPLSMAGDLAVHAAAPAYRYTPERG